MKISKIINSIKQNGERIRETIAILLPSFASIYLLYRFFELNFYNYIPNYNNEYINAVIEVFLLIVIILITILICSLFIFISIFLIKISFISFIKWQNPKKTFISLIKSNKL